MLTISYAVRRAVAFLLLAAPVAFAEADPPTRVARLSYTKGEVSLQPAGADEWIAAPLNRPLTTSDRLWTGENARADLSIGTAALRLGRNTGFSFLNLNDRTTQVQLTRGTLNVRLRALSERENLEVDTPNGAVTLLRTGDYRIDVYDEGNSTTVTVHSGYAQVDGNGRAFSLRAQQLARIYGGDSLEYTIVEAPAADEFDTWCMERNERMDRAISARYVSPSMIGYEELDYYGNWTPVPEYGMVWIPRAMPIGWAPYRSGHWIWIAPWGWTWVDSAPWGFAPFHYGRWAYISSGWAWVPGPIVVRPVYAPALVAFVGGNHWGIGFSAGSRPVHGWFPLGPHEPYYPGFRASRTYITNINITNTYIRNGHENFHPEHFSYAHEHRGITAAPDDVFRRGRPIESGRINVPQNTFRSTGMPHEIPPAPDRNNGFLSGNRIAPRPPAAIFNRPVQNRIATPVQNRIAAPVFEHRPMEAARAPEAAPHSFVDRPVRTEEHSVQQTRKPWAAPENGGHANGFMPNEPPHRSFSQPPARPGYAPQINRAPETTRGPVHTERAMPPQRGPQRMESHGEAGHQNWRGR
jgi:hypothetical protein